MQILTTSSTCESLIPIFTVNLFLGSPGLPDGLTSVLYEFIRSKCKRLAEGSEVWVTDIALGMHVSSKSAEYVTISVVDRRENCRTSQVCLLCDTLTAWGPRLAADFRHTFLTAVKELHLPPILVKALHFPSLFEKSMGENSIVTREESQEVAVSHQGKNNDGFFRSALSSDLAVWRTGLACKSRPQQQYRSYSVTVIEA